MGKSKELATLTDGLEQNLGTKIVAGDRTSTTGSQVLAAYYNGSGELGTIGGNASNGGLSVGYGVWPKPNTANAYVSSTDIPLYRSAVSLSGTIDMYMGTAQTVTTGSDVSMDKVFSIDSSGRVTTPYQPVFNSYRNLNVFSMSTYSVIPVNATRLNVGNHFNESLNRFTAPVSGSYYFYFRTIMRGNYNNAWLYFTKNGSTVAGSNSHLTTNEGSNWHFFETSTIVYMSAGDYVQVANGSVSTEYHGNDWMTFAGHLIG